MGSVAEIVLKGLLGMSWINDGCGKTEDRRWVFGFNVGNCRVWM